MATLIEWHHRLNHLSFPQIRLMAEKGLLPKSILSARTPRCASCLIGKATRQPWRTKSPPSAQSVPSVKGPGDCISVNQLQSTQPGLIAQLRGFTTKQRYHYATVFVDQYSSL